MIKHSDSERWWILLCFILTTGINSYQWIQYSIVSNIIIRYYNVSSLTVDMTSMIYMIVYTILFIPVSTWIDNWGLRKAMLMSTWITCLGTWLKVFSVTPNTFYIGFIGQTLLAIAQVFTFSVPAKLAAIWFGPSQVSTASGLGVLGMTIGEALSFITTPWLVRNHKNLHEISLDLRQLYIFMAIYSTLISMVIQSSFRDKPNANIKSTLKKPQSLLKNEKSLEPFKALIKNRPFFGLLIAYGINMGVLNTISTLLNPIILSDFPNEEKFAGEIGLILICTGLVSCPLLGFILDKTKQFKKISVIIYLMTAIGMSIFTLSVETKSYANVYLASIILGFFVCGYFSVGYEVAVELSYPISELNSAALLNAIAQIFGVVFTLFFGAILQRFGNFSVNLGFSLLLYLGTMLTILIKDVQRRQEAFSDPKYNCV